MRKRYIPKNHNDIPLIKGVVQSKVFFLNRISEKCLAEIFDTCYDEYAVLYYLDRLLHDCGNRISIVYRVCRHMSRTYHNSGQFLLYFTKDMIVVLNKELIHLNLLEGTDDI